MGNLASLQNTQLLRCLKFADSTLPRMEYEGSKAPQNWLLLSSFITIIEKDDPVFFSSQRIVKTGWAGLKDLMQSDVLYNQFWQILLSVNCP